AGALAQTESKPRRPAQPIPAAAPPVLFCHNALPRRQQISDANGHSVSPLHPGGCCSSRCSAVRRSRGLSPRSTKGALEHRRLMQKGIFMNLLDKEIRDVGARDEPASPVA